MKMYTKLPMPKDSSWGKKTWKYYSPIWFNTFAEGVYNIIRWIPTIYKDKDWDDFYITKLLQVKIEHQREYLVKHNRHENVANDNFYTIADGVIHLSNCATFVVASIIFCCAIMQTNIFNIITPKRKCDFHS